MAVMSKMVPAGSTFTALFRLHSCSSTNYAGLITASYILEVSTSYFCAVPISNTDSPLGEPILSLGDFIISLARAEGN